MQQEFAVRAISVAVASIAWQQAVANPTAPTVVNGTASFAASGSTLTVTNTPNAIINWKSFSIGAGELTRFNQQSPASAVLNRVTGPQNPSSILGTLQSNGRVFLINPSGITFGAGSTVDVAGLVASSLNLSDADFLSGRMRFAATPGAGAVVNNGRITTGGAGAPVYLVGPSVANGGVINSPHGEVVLAAGNSVEIANAGTPDVTVQVSAPDNRAVNLGSIVADSGRVNIFGGLIDQSGLVQANTAVRGENGKIILKATGDTNLAATSRTLAEAQNGDGGFIETSGAHVHVADGAVVSTAAANGKTGTWLIDPEDYTVAARGGDITGDALSSNLGTSNVTIQSSGGRKNGSGDVDVNDVVSWGANTTLTMTASNDVNVNAGITATGTTAGIVINPNTANGGEVASGTGQFNLAQGARINLPHVSPTSTTALVIGGTPYTVINSLGSPGSATGTDLQGMRGNLTRRYALGSDINASATSGWNGGAGFAPVTGFSGVFEGLGHTISGLTINRPTTDIVGLFGIATGRIAHVALFNASVTGHSAVGALVGQNQGIVRDSSSAGAVSGASNLQAASVGGLVGYNTGSVTRSNSSAFVSGGTSVGGLIGTNGGTVDLSHSTGSVNAFNEVGGLVGGNGGAVSESYSTGNVTGNGLSANLMGRNVGGLIGFNAPGGAVDKAYATGTVSGDGAVGGLIGTNWGPVVQSYSTGSASGGADVGGLVGGNGTTGAVSESYSVGAVAASRFGAGGLIGGNEGTVSNSYAMSPVSAPATVGGLIGVMVSGSVSDSYSTGPVTGGAPIGGLVGLYERGTVSNSFWDIQTSGLTTSAAGTGLTTRKMQTPATFTQAGWDRNVWLLRGNRYPQLRVFAQSF